MSSSHDELAREQIRKAVVTLCNQFEAESDLTEIKIVGAIVQALNEWMDEEVIEFQPD